MFILQHFSRLVVRCNMHYYLVLNCFILPYIIVEQNFPEDIRFLEMEQLINKLKLDDMQGAFYLYALLNTILILYSIFYAKTWVCIPYALVGLMIVCFTLLPETPHSFCDHLLVGTFIMDKSYKYRGCYIC
eukprot:UN27605